MTLSLTLTPMSRECSWLANTLREGAEISDQLLWKETSDLESEWRRLPAKLRPPRTLSAIWSLEGTLGCLCGLSSSDMRTTQRKPFSCESPPAFCLASPPFPEKGYGNTIRRPPYPVHSQKPVWEERLVVSLAVWASDPSALLFHSTVVAMLSLTVLIRISPWMSFFCSRIQPGTHIIGSYLGLLRPSNTFGYFPSTPARWPFTW